MPATLAAPGARSPETFPDATGPNRGTGAVTAYPERDSNPHALLGHKILSGFTASDAPVHTEPDRAQTEVAEKPEPSGSIPNGDRPSPEKSPDIVARIFQRVVLDRAGCWRWQGALNSQGYGSIRIGGRTGRTLSVHRVVAESCLGPIPADRMVCHHCDVRDCVNPAHLYIGTAVDNARDKRERGRAVNILASQNAAKTHCPNGHPYAGGNLMVLGNGNRRCRTCQRAQQRQSALVRQSRASSTLRGAA